MKKFIDTSNLAIYQSGKYQGKFDWINNIGKELYFEYDDISGYIKIVNYQKSKPQGYITLQYNDKIITTTTSNLLQYKCGKPTPLGVGWIAQKIKIMCM